MHRVETYRPLSMQFYNCPVQNFESILFHLFTDCFSCPHIHKKSPLKQPHRNPNTGWKAKVYPWKKVAPISYTECRTHMATRLYEIIERGMELYMNPIFFWTSGPTTQSF